MENAVEALIMAGQMLIFIIALTVCISSFTTVRVGVDNIIGQAEEVEFAKDSDGYINYIESRDNNATRVVGPETVSSAIYRNINENYIIYIQFNDNEYCTSIGKNDKFKGIIVKDNLIKIQGEYYVSDLMRKNELDEETGITGGNLYNTIKEKKFLEYVGEYQENTDASAENKETKRILTYIENEEK